jgi:hypothetical protein
MNQAQHQIKSAKADGFIAGVQYIKTYGIKDAVSYVNQLANETSTPSNQMFGYIDGFANAIILGGK